MSDPSSSQGAAAQPKDSSSSTVPTAATMTAAAPAPTTTGGAPSTAAPEAAGTTSTATASTNNTRKRPAPVSEAATTTTATASTTTTTDAEVAAANANLTTPEATAAATAAAVAAAAYAAPPLPPPSKPVMAATGPSPTKKLATTASATASMPTPRRGSPTTGGTPTSSSSKPAYKGLRHFSMMVCKKVEEKRTTTYNEVADELVQHVIQERRKEDPSSKFDEKNIRRRVYDALNVLMAMDIITKDKKAISWKGLPTTAHQDLDMLERERDYRKSQIQRKREALRELLVQQVCFRNLVSYNQRRSGQQQQQQQPVDSKDHKIPLPFIIVNTHSTAVIQCNMSRDLTDVMFDFSQPFEINDDNTILKRLGMDKTSRQVLQEMLPQDLMQYADQHGLLTNILSEATTVTPGAPPAAGYPPAY